jgi:hypothetical protein
VRQIAGVKVLQAPGNDSDLIAPYHTMNWTLDDAMRVRDKLGPWHRSYHSCSEKVATLSYPCLQQPKDQQPA